MLNILKNKKGSAIIIMTVLMLSSILTVTLIGGEIVRMGLIMGRDQVESAKAYFAAEAGLEEILWEIRKPSPTFLISSCDTINNKYYDFTNKTCSATVPGPTADTLNTFSNGAEGYIEYASNIPNIFKSHGNFDDIKRIVQISFP